MFAIFRKRSRKLSADLDALTTQAARLVERASAHIHGARQVIGICLEEIEEAQRVIHTVLDLHRRLRDDEE